MKLSSIVASATMVFLGAVNLLAYTVSSEDSFPLLHRSKLTEIANKASYERALILKGLIIQNLMDQDAVNKWDDRSGAGSIRSFLYGRRAEHIFNELDSILGVKK